MSGRTCPFCNGHGRVPRYAIDGSDFEGERECPECRGNGLVARRDAQTRFVAEQVAHVIFKTGDEDAPRQILDHNGDVVLALCRNCGRGEVELDDHPNCDRRRIS